LLMVPAVPLMFLALHRSVTLGSVRWAVAAALLWLWQLLTGLYFLLFLPLAALPWLLWFARPARRALVPVACFALAAAIVSPIVLAYRASHSAGAHTRDFG